MTAARLSDTVRRCPVPLPQTWAPKGAELSENDNRTGGPIGAVHQPLTKTTPQPSEKALISSTASGRAPRSHARANVAVPGGLFEKSKMRTRYLAGQGGLRRRSSVLSPSVRVGACAAPTV